MSRQQNGVSLYIPPKNSYRPNYRVHHTQVIREVESVTMVLFYRTGKRESKKVLEPITMEKKITLKDKILKKEKTSAFLARASKAEPEGYWMRINYKEKQIPHFDF